MKRSTFGIGVTVLLLAIGTVTMLFPNHGEDYVVRGQSTDPVPLPPAKLTPGAARTANPLRNDTPSAPYQRVSDVRQAQALRSSENADVPKNDAGSDKRFSGFDDIPDPFGSPRDNFMESAGFPDNPSPLPAAPVATSPEPKPLAQAPSNIPAPQPLPSPFDFPPVGQPAPLSVAPAPMTPSAPDSLGNADPFGAGTPTAVPPFAASPIPSPSPTSGATPITNPVPAVPAVPATPQASNRTPVRQAVPEAAFSSNEGIGMPGPVALEGAQTPHLTIEKVLPAEIVIDQPTTIKTVIRNVGRSPARDVAVRDEVPQGARLLSTSPEATASKNGELFWSLGHLDAGEQLIVEMRFVPLREGEIGSVATVNYSSEASARINVTRPKLHVDVKAPQEVRLGEIANVEITISNPGSATATGIVLEEYVPDGLYHKDGKVLVNKNVDSLKPREAKKLTLPLTCTGSGLLVNRLVIKANGNLKVEEKTTIRGLAPSLNLEIAGPKQRFLERKAGYRLTVSNSGNASAQNVDLSLALPTSMQFVSTNQSGVYEPSTHTVHWALEELPPQEAGEIELIVLPAKIGNYTLRFVGNGQNNLKAEATHPVAIDGLAAIAFEVVGQSLVEIGKETVYEIRVANKGTKSANNVRIRAALSDGLTFVKADGPVSHQSQGGVVTFESLARLDPKGEKIYTVRAKCMADGDHRISVQVLSDDLSAPITKEESTKVFQ